MNHFQGDKKDLSFFIAENMSGEMSTYRAAIQQELNKKIGSKLVEDGDLTFYLPYSTKINWSRRSKTHQTLLQFVHKHQYYFEPPVNPPKLLKELCRAGSLTQLEHLELYVKIMGKKIGLRIFPDIKSSLYNQTPYDYARIVIKKARLF